MSACPPNKQTNKQNAAWPRPLRPHRTYLGVLVQLIVLSAELVDGLGVLPVLHHQLVRFPHQHLHVVRQRREVRVPREGRVVARRGCACPKQAAAPRGGRPKGVGRGRGGGAKGAGRRGFRRRRIGKVERRGGARACGGAAAKDAGGRGPRGGGRGCEGEGRRHFCANDGGMGRGREKGGGERCDARSNGPRGLPRVWPGRANENAAPCPLPFCARVVGWWVEGRGGGW